MFNLPPLNLFILRTRAAFDRCGGLEYTVCRGKPSGTKHARVSHVSLEVYQKKLLEEMKPELAVNPAVNTFEISCIHEISKN